MIELHFDEQGFLMPYQAIEADLETLEYYFVTQFPNSKTRRRLFVNYLRYNERFRSRVTKRFVQWIDGSFVTQKQNPKDIDMVTFLDYRIFEAQEPFLDKFWTFNLEDQGLDAYLLRLYPPEHPDYIQETAFYQQEWQEVYGSTADKEGEEIFPKGFIQLNFT
ncbi:MAG: hypothetical protein NW226_21565 [Microscillaceae bacterium]|nr:hypothetical protein [Microscillaceae bacterium]